MRAPPASQPITKSGFGPDTLPRALVNLVVGAKINIVMFDILALIVVRPLSALVAAKVLGALVAAVGG